MTGTGRGAESFSSTGTNDSEYTTENRGNTRVTPLETEEIYGLHHWKQRKYTGYTTGNRGNAHVSPLETEKNAHVSPLETEEMHVTPIKTD